MAVERDYRMIDRRPMGMDLTYPFVHGDGRAIGQFTVPVTASGSAVFDQQSAYVPTLNTNGKLQSADNPTSSFTFNNSIYEATMMLWFKRLTTENGAVLFHQVHGSLHNVQKNGYLYSPITINAQEYNFQCYSQNGDNRGVLNVAINSNEFTPTNWNHLAYTIKSTAVGGSGWQMAYLNGVFFRQGSRTPHTGSIARDMSGPVTLFSWYNGTQYEASGRIQLASLVFRALSAVEIYETYRSQLGAFLKP